MWKLENQKKKVLGKELCSHHKSTSTSCHLDSSSVSARVERSLSHMSCWLVQHLFDSGCADAYQNDILMSILQESDFSTPVTGSRNDDINAEELILKELSDGNGWRRGAKGAPNPLTTVVRGLELTYLPPISLQQQ